MLTMVSLPTAVQTKAYYTAIEIFTTEIPQCEFYYKRNYSVGETPRASHLIVCASLHWWIRVYLAQDTQRYRL